MWFSKVAFFAPLVAGLCAVGCGAAPESNEDPAESSAELRGGQGETERKGVVQIKFCNNASCSSVSLCSGIVVARRLALTAGHCVSDYIKSTEYNHVPVKVRYKYGGQYHCISGSTDGNGDCSDWQDSIVSTVYQGNHDAETDLGKVSLVAGHADILDYWVSDSDLAYIYNDSMSYYGRLQGFGYGDDGAGNTGVLRTGTFEVDWYGSRHFITINRGAGTCQGDSGGPMMVYGSQSGDEPQVVGLISSHESRYFWRTDTCAASGQKTRSVRLSAWRDWIEGQAPEYVSCYDLVSPANSRKLVKCY